MECRSFKCLPNWQYLVIGSKSGEGGEEKSLTYRAWRLLGREKGANLNLEPRSLLGGKGSKILQRPHPGSKCLKPARWACWSGQTSDGERAQLHFFPSYTCTSGNRPIPLARDGQMTYPGPIIILQYLDYHDWSRNGHMIQSGQSDSFPGTLLAGARGKEYPWSLWISARGAWDRGPWRNPPCSQKEQNTQ